MSDPLHHQSVLQRYAAIGRVLNEMSILRRDIPIMIIKKDGRREVFSREKVGSGIRKACQKLDISINTIEGFIEDLERDLRETGEKEIPSHEIGERVMAKLHELNDIAYVRFASVYREFKDVNDFVSELKRLLSHPAK